MKSELGDCANKLVLEHGDQAYWKAVEFTVTATYLRDLAAAHLFSTAAIELMHRGYHKHPRAPKPEAAR